MGPPVPVGGVPFQREPQLMQEREPTLSDVLIPLGPFRVVIEGGLVTRTSVPPETGWSSKTSPPLTVRLV